VIRRTALAATCAVMLAAGATARAVGAADSGAVPHLRAPRACGRTPRQRPRIRHVIVIVLENHPAPAIIGHAPFITSLAHRCGYAARYHHNAKVSLPNYLAMTSGSIHGLRRDCMPKECHPRVEDLHATRPPREEVAGLPGVDAGPLRTSSGLYAARHNPAVYYRRIGDRQCRKHVVPLGSRAAGPLRHALDHRGTPAYMFVTPNLCHDMHDCPVAVGDLWVSAWIADDRAKPGLPRRPHRRLSHLRRGLEHEPPHPDHRRQPLHPRRQGVTQALQPFLAPSDDGAGAGHPEMPQKGLLGSRPFQGIPAVGGGRDSYRAEAIRRTSASSKRLVSRDAGRSPAAETTVMRRSAASACFAAILASVVRSVAVIGATSM
jgi:hypothetical protein